MPARGGSYTKHKQEGSERKSLGSLQRKELREELGRFICRHRNAVDINIEELSKRCGYNYPIAFKWENAQKPHVLPEDVPKLIEALKLPEDAFAPFMDIITKRSYQTTKDKEVGRNLRKRMQERVPPVNGADLARELGQYPQHIDGYLKGTSEPRITYLKKMVEALYDPGMHVEGMANLLYGEPYPRHSYRATIQLKQDRIDKLEREVEELRQKNEELRAKAYSRT